MTTNAGVVGSVPSVDEHALANPDFSLGLRVAGRVRGRDRRSELPLIPATRGQHREDDSAQDKPADRLLSDLTHHAPFFAAGTAALLSLRATSATFCHVVPRGD